MSVPNRPRSGGPRSAAGRAITAGNAIKTGAYCVQVVLPGEDAQVFEALKTQLQDDFAPVGTAELAMVHDLAVLIWKKLRIDRVEHAVLSQMALLPLREDAIQSAFGPGWLPAAMPRLVDNPPVTRAEYTDAQNLLAQAEALGQATAKQRTPAAVRNKWPELYAELQAFADACALHPDDVLTGAAPDGVTLESFLSGEAIAECETVIWLWDNRDQLAKAMQQARDARLLHYMKGGNNVTQRAFDDISRTFYRTLSELRRQQDWRIRRTAIDVQDATLPPPPPRPPPEAKPHSTKQTSSHKKGDATLFSTALTLLLVQVCQYRRDD